MQHAVSVARPQTASSRSRSSARPAPVSSDDGLTTHGLGGRVVHARQRRAEDAALASARVAHRAPSGLANRRVAPSYLARSHRRDEQGRQPARPTAHGGRGREKENLLSGCERALSRCATMCMYSEGVWGSGVGVVRGVREAGQIVVERHGRVEARLRSATRGRLGLGHVEIDWQVDKAWARSDRAEELETDRDARSRCWPASPPASRGRSAW